MCSLLRLSITIALHRSTEIFLRSVPLPARRSSDRFFRNARNKDAVVIIAPKSKTSRTSHGESSRALNKSLKSSLGERLALARGTFAVELYFGSGKDIGDIYAPLATIPADPTENFVDDLSVRHSMNPPSGPQQRSAPLRNTYRSGILVVRK